MFLRVQRRHVKFAICRFDGCAAGFRFQRADRHICLCGDRRVACRSRERIRFHAACSRCCCKRACGHVVQLRFVLARQRSFADGNKFLHVERASGICRHTPHGRIGHFHRATACEFCVFLRVQRRHVKFAFGRFDGCASSFRFQRADRHVRLGVDARVASRSRERICLHAAAGRNSKCACFCFGERDIVIGLDGRTVLGGELLEQEHAMGRDLRLSFFGRHLAFGNRRAFVIRIGEIAARGIRTVLDGSFICDPHRSRRGVLARRQLAAVCDGHRSRFRGIAAIGERARVGDVHRRAGHRCFCHCRISISVIGERTIRGESSVLDGLAVRDTHRPCFRGVLTRRQLAAVCDGHRTRFRSIAAILGSSFIGEGERTAGQRDIFHEAALAKVIDLRCAACKGRMLDGCGIFDGEGLCSFYLGSAEIRLIGQGGLSSCEGAAGDGAVLRIIDVKRTIGFVAAFRNLAVIGDGGIFCLDGSRIRCRFSEESDVGVACRMETDAARHRTAVFRFCAGRFHAEGLSFALAFDIDHVFDGNILSFDIRVGGAHFLICIMTALRVEAMTLEVECHIAVGGVNGMDDEVAVFQERDAFLRPGSEGAAFLNGNTGYFPFAGLEDDLVLRAHSDILEVVRRLHAELAAGEEFASFLHAGIAGKIDGAIFCFCDEFPLRIRCNGADGADGDGLGLVIYMEIPTLCGREGDQLVCRQALDLLFRREINLLSVFLVSDAARVLAIFHFAAKRCQGDILPRDMRGFFLRGLGISDALFDAAAGIGDEEILRGLRRADKDFCLFLRREVIIRFQVARFERSIAIDLAVRAVRDPLHIGFDAILRPSVDTAFQLIIALLFLCYIRIDVSDALLCQCLLRGVVQRVLAVFHIRREGLVLVVLALYLGDEEGFLFRNRRLAAFQDARLRPGVELRLCILIRHVGEIVVDEGTVRRQGDVAMLRSNAVKIEIAAGICDGNISIRAGFETIRLAASLLCLDGERAGRTSDRAAAGVKVHAACREHRSRCLRDAVFGCDVSDLARRYIAQSDIPFDIHREVATRTAGDSVCAGLDGMPRTADIPGRGHVKASSVDVAEIALREAAAGKVRCAAAIGERAIDEDVTAAAIDRERAAVFNAAKPDAHIVVRLEGILGHLRIVRGFDQFVIVFLCNPQRIPEALLFLCERRDWLCGLESLVRLHIGAFFLRTIDFVVVGDESSALQRAVSTLREVGHGAALRQHFRARRSPVIDSPPVDARVMQLIRGRGAAVLSRLHGVVRALRRLILRVFGIRIGRNRRTPRRISICIALDALLDHPILAGVGGLSCDFPALPIQIRDLDLPFEPAACGEGLELDVFIRIILHLDRAVAVEGFDAGFVRIIRRIEDGADDGDMPAVDFDITDDEAVIGFVIGNALDFLARLVRDEDLRAGRHLCHVRHIDFRAAIHVEELVVLRDGDRVIRDAALDFRVDIHVPRRNEDIAIRQDAASDLVIRLTVLVDIVQPALVIQRIAADAGNARVLPRAARIIGLDEIAVRRGHIHAARVNRALIVHVAIRTRDSDCAARVIDVALEIDIRCGVVGRGHIFALHIRLRAEIVLDRDRGSAGLVARLCSKGNGFRLVLVLLLDRRLDRLLAVALDLGAVEINRAALTGACRALTAYDVDISRHQIVRRNVRDLHFCITARLELARAGDIVPFEDDIPELRGDVAHKEIMRHLRVGLAVEEVVLLAVLRDLAAFDFIAVRIEELPTLLGAFLVIEEILRQLDLGVELMVVVDTDILRCLLLLFLLRQGVLLRWDACLVILRRVGGNRIAVGRIVAIDRTGICLFFARLFCISGICILYRLIVCDDFIFRGIGFHIRIQRLIRCRRQLFHSRSSHCERTLRVGS